MESGSALVGNPITNDTNIFSLNITNRLHIKGGTLNTFDYSGSGFLAINQTTIFAKEVIVDNRIQSGPYLDI